MSDGVIMTAGVRIVALDGSFTLDPHTRFRAPFRVAAPTLVLEDTIASSPARVWVSCVLSRLANTCARHFRSLAAAWPAFERAGARRVRVDVSGRGSYHGLLYLGDAPPDTKGRSGKHYKIEVPLEHLARAMETPEAIFGGGVKSGVGFVKTWILWVSANPLSQRDPFGP